MLNLVNFLSKYNIYNINFKNYLNHINDNIKLNFHCKIPNKYKRL